MFKTPTLAYYDGAGTASKVSHWTSTGGGNANDKTMYTLYASLLDLKVGSYGIATTYYGWWFHFTVEAEL